MKRIVLTGGGTAGHVTPHLAILPHLLAEGYEVHYIGTEGGIEHKMMSLPGVTYHAVKSGKLRRYFDWKNFTDPFRVIAGCFQAAHLMRKLRPDVCFSKGGFVSVPVVIGAWLHGVPVLCHESDLTPGLANKICARFAKRVATTFPECAKSLGPKAVCTWDAPAARVVFRRSGAGAGPFRPRRAQARAADDGGQPGGAKREPRPAGGAAPAVGKIRGAPHRGQGQSG